jgi:hypothetical protein
VAETDWISEMVARWSARRRTERRWASALRRAQNVFLDCGRLRGRPADQAEVQDIRQRGSRTWEGTPEKWILPRLDDDFLAGVEPFVEPRRRELKHSPLVYARARNVRGRITDP